MSLPVRGVKAVMRTMRLIGRKQISRTIALASVLFVLCSVITLLRDESRSPSSCVLQGNKKAEGTKRIIYSKLVGGLSQGNNNSTVERPGHSKVKYPVTNFIHLPPKDTDIDNKNRNDNNNDDNNSNKGYENNVNYQMIGGHPNYKHADKAVTTTTNKNKRISLSSKLSNSNSSTRSSPSSSSSSPSSSPFSRASNSTQHQNSTATGKASTREKFIIYVCDKSNYCYGLGDRQRAVSSLYTLSLVTNRTFGVIWTQPCPLTRFLEPNEVNWDIPHWRLMGKTSIELEFLEPKKWLNLSTPFNHQYPQDIVYIRTNHNLINTLKKHKVYGPLLPEWAQKNYIYATGYAWKKLMKPLDSIRKPLNEMLVKIFQDQQLDENLVRSLKSSKTCHKACELVKKYDEKNTNLTRSVLNDLIRNDKNVSECLTEMRKNQNRFIPENYYNSTAVDYNGKPIVSLKNLNMFCKSQKSVSKDDDRSDNNGNIGEDKSKNSIVKRGMSVEAIRRTAGYDVVDLNLVCIHARMGRSANMPFEKRARNSMESTKLLWDFARPFLDKGHHLYIATDYDKVRQDSQDIFGLRAHSSDAPIVHIASVQRHQNETEGMILALWEQLLLMTSCHTLVESHSGFSLMAGAVGAQLNPNKQRFVFEEGKIRYDRTGTLPVHRSR